MKFKKLLKKLKKVPKGTPVKFFYEGLKGDFFLSSDDKLVFYASDDKLVLSKSGSRVITNYTFSLEDFKRKDWQLIKR